MRPRLFGRRAAALATALLLSAGLAVLEAPVAQAAPVCPGAGQPPVLVATVPGGVLEGMAVDRRGRLYTTDLVTGRVYRIDAPGAPAYPIATVPDGGAGGLAWHPDGSLLVGYGADARVLVGDALLPGALAKLDVETGELRPFASGLSASNGIAVSREGWVYATNDFGSLVGQVSPDGVVNPAWASTPSANGAALSADGRYLYVAHTFAAPGVSRIPVFAPAAQERLVDFGGLDLFAAADGLILDSRDRPIVPTDVSGEILRVDGPNQFCALAGGLPLSSTVTYGAGTEGFSEGRLFRGGFDGAIYEIPGGFDG
ncbi:hypothetical protein G4H71_03945 [Rhodococcus triatomae]|uniref:SMP-30/Gluconolactonase/LRE-like region domain-containing protein n=1 Tax=Rhodococcus triatomae TaxID=300028 RepID=A0A1G7ZHI2_9NOCA|nr:hypothetical protein [Rhodococcus triatomae]QNG18036.1 hypothetical protein G4H72_04095 [Rhodococcus triatomae]QNG22293.1 hypothetical protein G4H71_03945 [Rhodococcus triatomae]SDH08241.1 hypothetical protein SAMN05444695_101115 [Rhodococcus triatomae]